MKTNNLTIFLSFLQKEFKPADLIHFDYGYRQHQEKKYHYTFSVTGSRTATITDIRIQDDIMLVLKDKMRFREYPFGYNYELYIKVEEFITALTHHNRKAKIEAI